VIAKWFKRGEEKEKLALRLRSDVLAGRTVILVTELMPLEVSRALVKVGCHEEKVVEAYSALEEMNRLGFIEFVSVSSVKRAAAELLTTLNLYVADAISLAVALSGSVDLLTEDRHLMRKSVREYARKSKVGILALDEMYHQSS
jgi:predicted nucleic acid-binding protein